MAIKKRRKVKDKKIKVEKSSSSNPPENAEESAKPKKESKKAEKDSKSDMNDSKTKTTPKPKAKKEEKTGLASYIEFLKLTRIEYKKINWPDRRQIVQETWTVLVLVTFITFLVLGYDWVLGNLVFGPLEHWIKINL